MLLPLALTLSLALPGEPAAAPAEAETEADQPRVTIVVVFRDGRSEKARGYEVDGDRVRVYELDGDERWVAKSEVDIDASNAATTAHLLALNRARKARRSADRDARLAAEGAAGDGAVRPELLYFTAVWCSWCDRLEEDVFTDPEVGAALGRYRLREVDFDADPELAAKFGVDSLPALVRPAVDGAPAKRRQGYLGAEALIDWLR